MSDQLTERIARALAAHDLAVICREGGPEFPGWERLTRQSQQDYLAQARAVVDSLGVDAAAGLLATARTRPTRQQIIEAIGHDGEWCKPERGPERCCDAPKIADAVLALWADQPTEAEAGARALEQSADNDDPEFHIEVALGGSDYVRGWLRERAARLRGGDR